MLAATGCDKDDKSAAKDTKPAEAKTPEAKTPEVTPPPETKPPEVTPPPTTGGIEGVGSFESIAAYCKDVKSKFVDKDCESMIDGGANMCSCDERKDQIKGKGKIGPLPEATGLASAELLVVERDAADSGYCDLAVETANGRGWLVVPKLMPCGQAPMSHDGDGWITVESFDVSRENDVDVLTLAWTETTVDSDVDGTETETEAKFTTRCTIGAATLPRCDAPVKK